VVDQLLAAGIRAHFDDRTNYTPGWKYNHWYPCPPPSGSDCNIWWLGWTADGSLYPSNRSLRELTIPQPIH
jgi:hypothetical protein